MRALITGISGFAGSHLAELLLTDGFEVFGTIRPRSRMENIEPIVGKIKLKSVDIQDTSSVIRVMKEVEPDIIFHLAAQSFVKESWDSPIGTLGTNILGCASVLEAVRQVDRDCTVQVAGSSEEYGMVEDDELPIKETNPLRPLSPYGVSKVAQDLLAQQYAVSFDMNVVVTRAFNHTGPRRGEVFATSNFAKQIALIEVGKQAAVIRHGNLEATRDFTDVRDTVRAYLLASESGESSEVYNICSGVGYSIGTMLHMLLDLSTKKITLEEDPDRLRPSDVPQLLGDGTRIRALGWAPSIPFEQTLKDLLNYWRGRV